MRRPRSAGCLPVAAVAVALLLVVAAHAFAAPPPADVRDFRSRAVEARAAVRGVERGGVGVGEARSVASRVQTLLPGTETLRTPTGEVNVDNSVVQSLAIHLAAAHTADARREAAVAVERQLTSIIKASTPATGPARTDPALLRRLLAEGRGDRLDLGQRLGELVASLLDWIGRAVERSGAARPLSTAWRLGFWVAVLALAAVLGVTAWRLVVRLRQSIVASEARRPRSGDIGAVVAAAEGLPPDALAYADDLAASGRFREAVRALFGGAARYLVERGVVAQTRTRTDGELLAEVAPAQFVHRPLSVLTGVFERAWYGHADPGADGFADARVRYAEVVRAADARRGEAS